MTMFKIVPDDFVEPEVLILLSHNWLYLHRMKNLTPSALYSGGGGKDSNLRRLSRQILQSAPVDRLGTPPLGETLCGSPPRTVQYFNLERIFLIKDTISLDIKHC